MGRWTGSKVRMACVVVSMGICEKLSEFLRKEEIIDVCSY
jgi:hypothetical protein